MKKFIICALCAICGFATANAQAKFGHVNYQEIIQAMPEYTKVQNELKALAEQYEADLKSMQDEIQKKGEALEKEQATLPENIKQRRQQELQDMYQKYQQSGPAGEDAGHHHQGPRRHQGRRPGRRLRLHHGDGCRHPLYQHHPLYRRHRPGEAEAWPEVIRLVNAKMPALTSRCRHFSCFMVGSPSHNVEVGQRPTSVPTEILRGGTSMCGASAGCLSRSTACSHHSSLPM